MNNLSLTDLGIENESCDSPIASNAVAKGNANVETGVGAGAEDGAGAAINAPYAITSIAPTLMIALGVTQLDCSALI